ncbi:hypothetical protein RSSM_00167 [Rhodopirellula sallentina SM41]|uniref:Uncharacterized protein n=1 Tax=Rhodopirellula sallentina SM41 TaxID=1263870 RepID=M5UQY1_9BACT|nr:hypothetical protein RSSM_00167 [Rhodopirellula sallentina SM41]
MPATTDEFFKKPRRESGVSIADVGVMMDEGAEVCFEFSMLFSDQWS